MKKRYFAVILFIGILLISLLACKIARAAFPGEGLTISPPISEPKIKPGQSAEQIIRLTNPTEKLIEVYPQVMDFKANGEGGEPSFYNAETDGGKFSLAKWIKFDVSKIAMTPEQVVEFHYTITLPTDAEPGGHYGAVFFVSEPPKDDNPGSKVSIGSMVGSLVLLTVPGDTIEKGIVDNFSTGKALYLTGNTVNVDTRISNVGNIHFKPRGNVVIKNLFGKTESVMNFNEQSGNVLPDSTRKFENSWKHPWYQLGRYKAELAVIYGTSEKPLTAMYTFWIIPWWLIVALALSIFAIVLLILLFTRKRRLQKKIERQTKSSSSLVRKFKEKNPEDTDHKVILR